MSANKTTNAMESNKFKSYFMPSEVSRLVLGYLKENNYVNTYKCFLKECVHLTEFVAALKAGREYPMTILGLTLVLMLEDYGKMKLSQVKASETIRQPKAFICGASQSSRMRKQQSDALKLNLSSSRCVGCPSQSTQNKLVIAEASTSLVACDGDSVTCSGDQGWDSQDDDASVDVVDSGDAADPVPPPPRLPLTPPPATIAPTTPHTEKVEVPKIVKVSHSELVNMSLNEIPDTEDKATSLCSQKDKDNSNTVSPKKKGKSPVGKPKRNKGKSDRNDLIPLTSDTADSSSHCASSDKGPAPCTSTPSATVEKRKSDSGTECTNKKSTVDVITSSDSRTGSGDSGSAAASCEPQKGASVAGGSSDGSDAGSTKSPGSSLPRSYKDRPPGLVDLDGNTCEAWASSQPGIREGDAILDILQLGAGSHSQSNSLPDEEIAKQLRTPRKEDQEMARASDLVTPRKLLQAAENNLKSPRRKKPKTPRKRPDVAVAAVPHEMEDPMFQEVLNDTKLIEKLTETCNIVNEKVKLSTSNKEAPGDQQDPAPIPEGNSEGLPDTVTGSRSLEEVLDMGQNLTNELSNNIDMSDPAFESLFRLFGTDKTTFMDETARKQQEAEVEQATAALTAEVEELERSIHEMVCGNIQISQKDEGYETQRTQCTDSVATSPHASPHTLYVSHSHPSTPSQSHPSSPYMNSAAGCLDGHISHPSTPSQYVNPTHSHSPGSTGVTLPLSPVLHNNTAVSSLISTPKRSQGSDLRQPDESPARCVTQPFSPTVTDTLNFSASTPRPPSTPQQSEHCKQNLADGTVPESPYSCYSSLPTTPSSGSVVGYSTPHRRAHTPVPPSPLTVDSTSQWGGAGDYYLDNTLVAQSQSHAPTQHCGQQVFMSSGNYQLSPATYQSQVGQSSQPDAQVAVTAPITSHAHEPIGQQGVSYLNSYMNFVNDVMSSEESSSTPITDRAVSTFASTIDNTIGCISLPPSTSVDTNMPPPSVIQGGKPKRNKKACDRQLLKKTVISNASNHGFSELKSLLAKPLQSQLPLAGPALDAPDTNMGGSRTPDHTLSSGLDIEGNEIMILSPGGNSCFKIPILGCQDENEIDTTIDGDTNETVKLWTQNLNSSIEYAVVAEDDGVQQITANLLQPTAADDLQPLLYSIPENMIMVPEQISEAETVKGKNNRKQKKEKAPRKTYVKKDKAGRKSKKELNKPASEETSTMHPLLQDDVNEILTATPLLLGDTLQTKKVHVRSLNFGPITTEVPSIRKNKMSKTKTNISDNATTTGKNVRVHLPKVSTSAVLSNTDVEAEVLSTSVTTVDILSIKTVDTGQYVTVTPKHGISKASTNLTLVKESPPAASSNTIDVALVDDGIVTDNNDKQQGIIPEIDLEHSEDSSTQSHSEKFNDSHGHQTVHDVKKPLPDETVITNSNASTDPQSVTCNESKPMSTIDGNKSPKVKCKVGFCPKKSKSMPVTSKKTVNDCSNKKVKTSTNLLSANNKTSNSKIKKGNEKIKVKFVNKKETMKKNVIESVKLKPATKLKRSVCPRKKSRQAAIILEDTDSCTSEDSVPLIHLKQHIMNAQNKKVDGNVSMCGESSTATGGDDTNTITVNNIINSNPGSDAGADQTSPRKRFNHGSENPRTPEKQVSSTDDYVADIFTPSKQTVFEKLGLTPKKDAEERAERFQSPTRGNILDYLAELRNSPKSSRLRSPSCRRRQISSPVTPKRRTSGKKLFASDKDDGIKSSTNKHISKNSAVNSEEDLALKSQTKSPCKTKSRRKPLFRKGNNKEASAATIDTNNELQVDRNSNSDVNTCINTKKSQVKSMGTEANNALEQKPGFGKLVNTLADKPNVSLTASASQGKINNLTYIISPTCKVQNGTNELADGMSQHESEKTQESVVMIDIIEDSTSTKHKKKKRKEHTKKDKSQKKSKEKSRKKHKNHAEACDNDRCDKESSENKMVGASLSDDWNCRRFSGHHENYVNSRCISEQSGLPNKNSIVSNKKHTVQNEKCTVTDIKCVDKEEKSPVIDDSDIEGENGPARLNGSSVQVTNVANKINSQNSPTVADNYRVKPVKIPHYMHTVKGTNVKADTNHVRKLLSSPTKAEIRANARPEGRPFTATAYAEGAVNGQQSNQRGKQGQKRHCDETEPLGQNEPKKMKPGVVDKVKVSLDLKNLDVMKALSQIYNI